MKQVICVRSSFLEQVTHQKRMALDRVAIRVSPRNPTRQITQSGINYNRARTRSGKPLGLEWSHSVKTENLGADNINPAVPHNPVQKTTANSNAKGDTPILAP